MDESHGSLRQKMKCIHKVLILPYINQRLPTPPPTANTSIYVITYTVDARDVFECRNVSLRMKNGGESSQSHYSRSLIVTGGIPTGPPVDLSVVATVVAANQQILLQNEGLDGGFDLAYQATGIDKPPRMYFRIPRKRSRTFSVRSQP
ncbi:uncharacterized protein Z519_01208 [Cladophialophora bantiana CBS 173.52]|uniref:Uncharacterized protein n=1 Tax=Cladophialophora bantiana (strain ATCC 10958 / CBS 173.52 / CDC B-1940 / NIH 8579) TaxID=1442370 RepID=A0A0D2ILF0_CLAB1|nr:uncharacterized protein Z519_01208 [Cladophialophora bantiana CBS 173.52]KIW97624.1 hypothetical protein Z519_01208 [Cladophialophora bantiana CBS 173.52]